MGRLQDIYESNCRSHTDIYEHLPTLRRYADMCNHVTEFGVEYGRSTSAFLSSKAEKVFSYDIIVFGVVRELQEICKLENTHWEFRIGDSRKVDIEPTDLLFIDTHHYYQHLKDELVRNGHRVRKYIIMHDTQAYKYRSTEGRDPQGVL